MNRKKYAVIADIHGNSWALKAVLADIENRDIDKIINLGDHLYGPLDPAGTADILMKHEMINVMGNQDRVLVRPEQKDLENTSVTNALNQLSEEHLAWLKSHPFSSVVDDSIFICHGSPTRDDEYLLMALDESGLSLRSGSELLKRKPEGVSLLLCGHDHTPNTIQADKGFLLHNPGSVGLQAYDDDLPYPHIIETGSPLARYSIVEQTRQGWRIESVTVPYNWQAASETAGKNGREDWAKWLVTGRA